MNIERIPERLTKWVVILCGLALSALLGQQIGNGNFGTVSIVFLFLGIGALALAIPNRLWMAVPIAWPLAGQIPALGLPATVRDLVVGGVFLVFLLLIAFKIIRRKPEMSLNDLLIWLTVFYLAAAFIRNPVGVAALDSDRVGGRPYFNVMIGFLAYWILSRSAIPSRNVKTFSLAYCQIRTMEGVIAQSLLWFPALITLISIYYISPTFTWAVDPDALPADPSAETTARLGYLAGVGVPLATYVLTVYRPLSCIQPANYGRFSILLIAIYCILASGFRSSLIMIAAYALVSSYLHSGKDDLWKMAIMGIAAVIFLAVGQGTFFELPRSAQRALSFLPGNWDNFALDEARDSTKWRLEMWEQMLFTDKYIDNKILGDGFGFKRMDLERMQARRAAGFQNDQEDFMTSGGVHSGPVTAIRVSGYVGLALHLVLLFSVARTSWKLLWRAKGGPWQALACLICIPAIIEPFFFTLIFGAYEGSIPETFFIVGMLQMLNNSLKEPEDEPLSTELFLPALDTFEESPSVKV